MRIGQGFDIHPFSDDPERRLVLGGVVIAESGGLVGHSDADALSHAVADALLGAAGLGDLGRHYPDTDPRWAGADSLVLLADVVDKVRAAGFQVANVDSTVVAEAPRLAPFVARLEEQLSVVLGAPVSVKATRAEQLGALGRREGIACLAVALLRGPGDRP